MERLSLGLAMLAISTVKAQAWQKVWSFDMALSQPQEIITAFETNPSDSFKIVVSGLGGVAGTLNCDPAYRIQDGGEDCLWFWNGKRPRPTIDKYNSDHTYEYRYRGTGRRDTFSFADDPYWDNVGVYHFEIYRKLTPDSIEAALAPNPATSYTRVTATAPIQALAVYDATGQRVYARVPEDPIGEIDVSFLPEGIYFVECFIGRKVFKFKFIKGKE